MGLFDRLFRQEKTDSQETLANKELTEVISEMDSIADQDLSSSELTTGNQAGQFSKTDTQVEEDLSTESVVTDESEEALTEELSVDNQPSSESEIASESVDSQATVDSHFADVMADYYAKKAQVAAAAEKGEIVTLKRSKPVRLRKQLQNYLISRLKQSKKSIIVRLRRLVLVLLLA